MNEDEALTGQVPPTSTVRMRRWIAGNIFRGASATDWFGVVAGFAALCSSRGCAVGFLLVLKYMADLGASPNAVGTQTAMTLGLTLAALKLADGSLAAGKDIFLSRPIMNAVGRGMLQAHTAALSLPYAEHQTIGSAALSQRLGRGARDLYVYYVTVLSELLPLALDVGLACWVISKVVSAGEGVVLLFCVAAYVFSTYKLLLWRLPLRKRMELSDLRREALAADTYSNIAIVKSFGRAKHECGLFRELMLSYTRAGFLSQSSLAVVQIAQTLLFSITLAWLLFAAGVSERELTVGTAILIVTLVVQLFVPLGRLGGLYREVQHCELQIKPFAELALYIDETVTPLRPSSSGELSLQGITVYTRGRRIVEPTSLHIPDGARVAVVGPSGSGKTTLLRTIAGLQAHETGRLAIGECEMKPSTSGRFPVVVYAPQEPTVFRRSLLDNFFLAGEDATRLPTLLRRLRLDDVIRGRKPDSEEFGALMMTASGGERQRFALVRGLLAAGVRVIAFDEPSSSLDPESEATIFELLLESRGPTRLVATHRVEYCARFDLVVFMRDGAVHGAGSHAELLTNCEAYRSFVGSETKRKSDIRAEVS
jgi:ATP-binding cassette, subfamily B, heavy metal transporter